MEHVLRRGFLDDFVCFLTPSLSQERPSYLFHLTLYVIFAYFTSYDAAMTYFPFALSNSSFSHRQVIIQGFVAYFSMTFINGCTK